MAVAFWAGATFIVWSGDERVPYNEGMNLVQPVFSRVRFELINETRTAELRKKAQQDVPNHFRLNEELVAGIKSALQDLHAAVKGAESFEKYQEAHGGDRPLDAAVFEKLKELTDETGSERFKQKMDGLADRLAAENMVERAEMDLVREVRSTASEVMLGRANGKFSAVRKEKLTYASNPDHVDKLAADLVQYLFGPDLKEAMVPLIEKAIVPGPKEYRPVYVFDREETKARIEQELAKLEPVRDAYEPGERLVKTGLLDDQDLVLLKAEQGEYLRQRNIDPQLLGQWRKQRLGLLGVMLFITSGMSIYTARTQPRLLRRPARAIAFAALLLTMVLLDRLLLGRIGSSPAWSVTTISMTAAILTIAYSPRFAFGATISLALLTVVTIDAPLGILVVYLTVAAATVMLLREFRTRLKMVVAGGQTAALAFVSAAFVGLMGQQNLPFVLMQSGYAALGAMGGISLVLVMLPVIEKVFRITTSLTLLEWADTSNALLRQLIEKAPGTWQHSHLLGSVAEAAAEEIQANGLLARVGAYYHDIGKICKPNYFIENQEARLSAHRGLAPTMSLLVILTHVKDGLALAREHHLPPVLHQFISEHHGTTVVKYFHAMAEKQARAAGRPEISDTEFRYPGPRPSSRESAILMLCDSVEGAVRAMQDPTPGRIEGVVHEVTMNRLMDGQFDDCEITLKELSRVEQSLVKNLRAIYHGRIAYPDQKDRGQPQIRSA